MILNNKLTSFAGNAIDFNFQILNEDGTYFDLSSVVSGEFVVLRENPNSDDTIILDSAITVDDAENGLCSVSLDDDSMNVSDGSYIFKLIFNFDTDVNRVLGFGEIVIKGEDVERIQQIKKLYGLNYDNYTLSQALNWARRKIRDNGFEKVVTRLASSKDTINICTNIVDINNDGEIDESEFVVKQFMTSSPYTVEDISEHILSVNIDNPIGIGELILDSNYPEEGFDEIEITYYVGSGKFEDIKEDIYLLEEYYVLWRLFDILEPYKLQHGVSSKTLNGVTIDFDKEGIAKFKEDLKTKIYNQRLRIVPFRKCQFNNAGKGGLLKSVLIPKSY